MGSAYRLVLCLLLIGLLLGSATPATALMDKVVLAEKFTSVH